MSIERHQIAGMNLCYRFYSFDYFLDSMEALGYKSIELWGGAPHFYFPDLSVAEIMRMRKKIAAHDLRTICFTPEQCSYPINIAYHDSWARERSLRFLERAIYIAAELESQRMLVTPGYGYFDEPITDAWSRCAESLKRLSDIALREGVTIVLEPLRKDETNLITSLPALKQMIEEVHSPALKGMLDTSPMYFAGESIRDYFKCLGENLRHIHFIDGAPAGHLVWGDGIFPLEEYLGDISAAQYTGYLTIELTAAQYYNDPHCAMERTMKALSPYLK